MGGWMQLGLDGMYGMGPARVLRDGVGSGWAGWVLGGVGSGAHIQYRTCMGVAVGADCLPVCESSMCKRRRFRLACQIEIN